MEAEEVTEQQKTNLKLQRILDLELEVSVVLAENRLTLGEVLQFSEGHVLSFKKHNTEPLDILVNHRTIGRGKAIKVGERFGLHVREVGPPKAILEDLVAKGD